MPLRRTCETYVEADLWKSWIFDRYKVPLPRTRGSSALKSISNISVQSVELFLYLFSHFLHRITAKTGMKQKEEEPGTNDPSGMLHHFSRHYWSGFRCSSKFFLSFVVFLTTCHKSGSNMAGGFDRGRVSQRLRLFWENPIRTLYPSDSQRGVCVS